MAQLLVLFKYFAMYLSYFFFLCYYYYFFL